jgi:peptide/nickel transport system substrate-binding protein
MHLLFLPLFTTDQNGETRGVLVRDWEASPDRKTWTYHLRTDVHWHDGTPVSVRDIEYSIWLKRESLREGPEARQLEIVNDSVFRITYNAAHFPYDPYSVYLPSHILDGVPPDELWNSDFWEHPVGNGPYRFARQVPETMVELEANPDFYLGKPGIDRVILKLRGGAAWMDLERGDVDATGFGMVEGPEAARLAEKPEFRRYWNYVTPGAQLLFINHRHPALGDVRVRQAITHAIDRRTMKALADFPDDVRLFDVPLSEAMLNRGEAPQPASYDPDLSRRLLEDAGWTDRNRDGIREKGGDQLQITVMLAPSPQDTRSAVLIQENLGEVGFGVEIENLAHPVRGERHLTGQFDLSLEPRSLDGLFGIMLGEPLGVNPLGGYFNPALVDLVASVREAVDPNERERLYREMWSLFKNEVPIIYLLPQVAFNVTHRRVKGLRSPHWVWPEMHMGELWIEEEEGGRAAGPNPPGGGS